MTKPRDAGPIALKLREFANQNGYTLEEINRAMVILSNISLHHLLGKGKTKGEARKRYHGPPAKPTANHSVFIDDAEHCSS